MKVLIRVVGKMRDKRLAEICTEYMDRTRRHLPVEVGEVESDADLLRSLPAGAHIIALEAGGRAFDTPGFAGFIEKHMTQGTRALVFLIGGADGLAPATVAASQSRMSLSPLTLPHRLARVVLCEQIYRALSIIRGEPYDR